MDKLFDSENIIDFDDTFFDNSEESEEQATTKVEPSDKEGNEDDNNPTEEYSEDSLFDDDSDESPESVGEEQNTKTKEKTTSKKSSGSSLTGENLYSSFAQALYGDGLFKSLNDESINEVVDADSFADAIENEVTSRLDERTKRIDEALNLGVEPNVIRQYENTINQLNNIEDDNLIAETEQGANLRATIIKQDYINRGFSPERATREVKRSIEAGTDVDDAKEALDSVKDFFQTQYNNVLAESRKVAEEEQQKLKAQAKEFKESLLNTDKLFDIPVEKNTRQKAYEYMTKIVKTSESGEKLTAVQAYADENPVEFRKILGIVAAITDGFTKPNKLFNKIVDNKVRSNLRQIESKITNSQKGGSIKFIEDEDGDFEPKSSKWRLDI